MDVSTSSIVQLFLVNNGIFSSPASGIEWPAYLSYFPDPENDFSDTAAIFDMSPSLDGRWMVDGSLMQHRGVLVRIRSSDYITGWQKAMDLFQLLAQSTKEDLSKDGSTYRIDTFAMPSGIIYLGIDDGTKRRYNFEISYLVAIRQTA